MLLIALVAISLRLTAAEGSQQPVAAPLPGGTATAPPPASGPLTDGSDTAPAYAVENSDPEYITTLSFSGLQPQQLDPLASLGKIESSSLDAQVSDASSADSNISSGSGAVSAGALYEGPSAAAGINKANPVDLGAGVGESGNITTAAGARSDPLTGSHSSSSSSSDDAYAESLAFSTVFELAGMLRAGAVTSEGLRVLFRGRLTRWVRMGQGNNQGCRGIDA